jgi:hypothetical protein
VAVAGIDVLVGAIVLVTAEILVAGTEVAVLVDAVVDVGVEVDAIEVAVDVSVGVEVDSDAMI